ncbi:hypothetical protein ACHQM5_007134 [Ranunculus cassubicifolius]
MKLLTFLKPARNTTILYAKTAPLQVRLIQADYTPRDPKSKPKSYKYPPFYDPYAPKAPPSEKVTRLAEKIAALSPEELGQIGPNLHKRLKHPELQKYSTGGIESWWKRRRQTLEKFDVVAKIKEVPAFTGLGWVEAKDLVEKAPVLYF